MAVPKKPLIGFNDSEDVRRLLSILAAKKSYTNPSELLRALVRQAFSENFTPEQISELLEIDLPIARGLLGELDGAEHPKDFTGLQRGNKVAGRRK